MCLVSRRPHYNSTVGPQTPHTRFYTPRPRHSPSPWAPTDTRRSSPPRTRWSCSSLRSHPQAPPSWGGYNRRPSWRRRSLARQPRSAWIRLESLAGPLHHRRIRPLMIHSRQLGTWTCPWSGLGSRESAPINDLTRRWGRRTCWTPRSWERSRWW